MKKAIKLMAMLLFAATLTTMVSCSKSNENLIIGKWLVTSDKVFWYSQGNLVSTDDHNWENRIWEFRSDGIMVMDGLVVSYATQGDSIFWGKTGYRIVELTNSTMVVEHDQRAYVTNDDAYRIFRTEFTKQ